jgi:hypothetical protein
MDPYLARYNNYINLSAILTAANKRIEDLPIPSQLLHPNGGVIYLLEHSTQMVLQGETMQVLQGPCSKE